MVKQSTIRFLFHMIYFSNFWNTFIAQYYQNLSQYQGVNEIFFYLIMTILKIICPALSGFIIDHVQFTLNILFIGQWLTIVSYIYFIANIYRGIDDYLYFAIGFQILGQQLQKVIILTMISKHFTKNDIPLQIAYFYQYGCCGRLLCSTIFFFQAIFTMNTDRLKYETNIQLILSMIPFSILLSLAFCIYRSFPIFRLDIYAKIPELEYIPITSKSNLLQTIKNLCKTDIILIAIAASAVMSIIQIWQQQLLNQFYTLYSKGTLQDKDEWVTILSFIILELPIMISIFIAQKVANKMKTEIEALQYLNDATSNSLVYFILSALQLTCHQSLRGLKLFILIVTLIMQQYNQTILSISSTILIGVKKNQRTLGLSFGILSMFTNLFEIWVICVLSQPDVSSQQMMAMIYGFALCYCILGLTLAKMLQFVNQIKIGETQLQYDSLRILSP